jgi:hypothetical protein
MKKYTASALGLFLFFALQASAQEHYTEGPILAGDPYSRRSHQNGCLPDHSAGQYQNDLFSCPNGSCHKLKACAAVVRCA